MSSGINQRLKFLVTPFKHGGEYRSIDLKKLSFTPPASKRALVPSPFLVIGFDTEYQRLPRNDDGKISLDNDVLSYQYSCLIVDPLEADETIHWSGIILPEDQSLATRLSLQDFVGFAISEGLAQFQTLLVPSDVYMVAHFTRADVPSFSDFKNKDSTRSSLNLENIRNTFVNIKNDIGISLFDTTSHEDIPLNVRIRDTMTLAPTGAKKLDDLGEILNFKKMKLADTPEAELHIKKNMAQFLDENWATFREYAIRDTEVCSRYTAKMIRLYHQKTGKFKLPVTLTSIGIDLLKAHWLEQGLDPYGMVGKEVVTERYWSKKWNKPQVKKKVVFQKSLHWHIDFFTECYHGGRNEQFWFGPAYKDIWFDYDLTSAYPSAMSLIGHPDWSKIYEIKSVEELLKYKPVDLAFANINFEFPEDVKYPVLPVRTESGLIFPSKGNCSTHISEILLAAKLGCKIELVSGRFVPSERFGRQKGLVRPFLGFTKYCIDERRKSAKNSLNNLFWKELVNSTYGKTAQGLRERRIYDLRADDTKKLEESLITNPVYAAFITSFCRGTLSELMNALPADVNIFSVTTDGFLTTATDAQMKSASNGLLCHHYMDAKRKLAGLSRKQAETLDIYEIKHIIRQPLGWRTRAQATIEPSQPEDWSSEDGSKEDNRIVLAKGGIKLDRVFNKREENQEILRLFFARKPTDSLLVTMGIGIREMYIEGTDFVDKEMDKRLSMEFDWKRCPKLVGEVLVDNVTPEPINHLFFSTKPWDDFDQYMKVRRLWQEYNAGEFHCLKTVSDYNEFASFLDNKLSLEGSAGKYLAKTSGDMKRLRRDLIIAYKFKRAGTHHLKPQAFGYENIFPTLKLKSVLLAEILNDHCKVPTTKMDVDNARKKKVFEPNQVPNTLEVRKHLHFIKSYLFPYLKIEELLAGKGAFDIHSVAPDQCIFSSKML